MTSSQYSLVRDTYHGQKVESPINFNMGLEIVPRYPSLGYDALTHGRVGTGLGYYNVAGAYPSFAGSCTRFGKRECSGLVAGSSTFVNGNPPHLPSAVLTDSGPGPLRNNNSPYNDNPTRSYDARRGTELRRIIHTDKPPPSSNGHSTHHATVPASHPPASAQPPVVNAAGLVDTLPNGHNDVANIHGGTHMVH